MYIHMKEYASNQSRILVADLSLINRRKIKKNRIAYKILISALFYFATIYLREVSQICYDSFTRGQPPISVTGHWRILSYVYMLRIWKVSWWFKSQNSHFMIIISLRKKGVGGELCCKSVPIRCLFLNTGASQQQKISLTLSHPHVLISNLSIRPVTTAAIW